MFCVLCPLFCVLFLIGSSFFGCICRHTLVYGDAPQGCSTAAGVGAALRGARGLALATLVPPVFFLLLQGSIAAMLEVILFLWVDFPLLRGSSTCALLSGGFSSTGPPNCLLLDGSACRRSRATTIEGLDACWFMGVGTLIGL